MRCMLSQRNELIRTFPFPLICIQQLRLNKNMPISELLEQALDLIHSLDKEKKTKTEEITNTIAPLPPSVLATFFDHTLLKADATPQEVSKLCQEAKTYRFSSVCVNSCYIEQAKKELLGSAVKVCSVIGFPLGAMLTSVKVFEAQEAVRLGADEIDMVISLGALKSGNHTFIREEIEQIVQATRPAIVKVILETGSLTSEEKVIGSLLSKLAGAHFVKTSTGFGKGGATIEDVSLLRKVVGTELGVKASGGIRTKEDVEKMIAAGASRVGTSSSVAIINQAIESSEKPSSATLSQGGY